MVIKRSVVPDGGSNYMARHRRMDGVELLWAFEMR